MRVLLVNDNAPGPGSGVEVYLARLAEGLEAAGDTVSFFAGEVRHRGVAKALDLWDPFARRSLQRHAGLFRPDVIHHHNVLRELSVSVLGVPAGTPCVLTVHDYRLIGHADQPVAGLRGVAGQLLKQRLDRIVARRRADVVLAVSAGIERGLRDAGFPNVEQTPVFAMPPNRSPPPLAETTDIAFAGRLTADKGVGVLIDAFGRLIRSHPATRLLIAGEGPERRQLELAAAALPCGRVEFLGRLDEQEVSALLAGVRVVAVPSIPGIRPEGSPLIAVEAALHGRPVVASDDPGLTDIVRGGAGGLVVPAGSAGDLASALGRLLDDTDLATQLGSSGREAALQSHTTDAVVPKIRTVYRRLVEMRGQAGAGTAATRDGRGG